MFRYLLLCGVLCSWLAGPVWAEVPAGLYDIRLPVPDQSQATLKQAARDGLGLVLQRLTGPVDLSAYPAVQPFLMQAERYVAEFTYETPVPASPDAAEPPPAFWLNLKFAPAALEQVVRNAGLPLWPVNRPPVLVWWVMQDNGLQRRLARDQDPAWFAAMEQAARDHGVPLQWPLNDLDDRIALDAATLWQLDENHIRTASQRYGNAWVVAGRFTQASDGHWVGNWLLLGEGLPQQLEINADDEATATATLMALVADTLAARYRIAVTDAPANAVTLTVSGLVTFPAYMKARAVLQGLASVESVVPVSVRDDTVTYQLALMGDPASLRDELALRNELEALPATSGNDTLAYRWRQP